VYPPVTDTGWITDEVRAFVEASSDHVHVSDPADVAEVTDGSARTPPASSPATSSACGSACP